jgi:5-methyltetrahydrofolate corrinoid/iron sulfur protein methyltransferase
MILIGENINIMSKTIGPAMREKNAKPIQELAVAETKAGVDFLDLNVGPARKGGEEMMQWVVSTVQSVTGKSISLDTTNPVAMEAGLKAVKGKALINSISLQPNRLDLELPLVSKYNADMIGLLWGVDGMPRDANERCAMAVDIVYKANMAGVPNENIWIDPIVSPVSVEINQVKSCIEFMAMLSEICPGCKSTVGLSNISNGTPDKLRPVLNRTYMIMLMRYGLYSAIVDAFDADLIKIARGQRADIVDLVHKVMDGETPNMSALTKEQSDYVKTVKVLTGDTLYSHSWLEV